LHVTYLFTSGEKGVWTKWISKLILPLRMEGNFLPTAAIQLLFTPRPSALSARLCGPGKKTFTLYQGSLAGIKQLGREQLTHVYLTPILGIIGSIPPLLLYAFMSRQLFPIGIDVTWGVLGEGTLPQYFFST
jgi:hypothetical protein